MKSPNNWGPDYVKAFDAIYPDLAAKYGVALYPFFLEGVALDQSARPGRWICIQRRPELPRSSSACLPDVEAFLEHIAQRKTAGK